MSTVVRIGIAGLLLLATAGCAEKMIVLKDPRTGRIEQCRRGAFGGYQAETCATALESDGWLRLKPRD